MELLYSQTSASSLTLTSGNYSPFCGRKKKQMWNLVGEKEFLSFDVDDDLVAKLLLMMTRSRIFIDDDDDATKFLLMSSMKASSFVLVFSPRLASALVQLSAITIVMRGK